MNNDEEKALLANVKSTNQLLMKFTDEWARLELHLQKIVNDANSADEALKAELIKLMHEQFMLKEVADQFMALLVANEKEKMEKLDSIKKISISILKVVSAIGVVVTAWAKGKGIV